jgi:hypothetical protein
MIYTILLSIMLSCPEGKQGPGQEVIFGRRPGGKSVKRRISR